MAPCRPESVIVAQSHPGTLHDLLRCWKEAVLTVECIVADALDARLVADFRRAFGSAHDRLAELLGTVARLAIECISNSDALHHNFEHTMLVTLAGREILRGRALRHPTSASDWAHFITACLLHDIGFVRGLLSGDTGAQFVVDRDGTAVTLARGASDAALAPHHVDRAKLFVRERFAASDALDPERLANLIEFTRFPPRDCGSDPCDYGVLVRAADLVGQLGDPQCLRKANALFHEFAETGMNAMLGYDSPADIVEKYPVFYWRQVCHLVEPALRHLNVTAEGRTWIAHVQANVVGAERFPGLRGPQQ